MNLSPPWRGDCWGVVVARSFATAKSRVKREIGGEAAGIARGMFERVMAAVRGEVERVIVATDGEDVAAVAAGFGAEVVWDREKGLARVVDGALERVAADAAIVCMADLPWIVREDVRAIRTALGRADVVIAPDRAERGTNAIGVRLPARTCFGNEDSFRRHVAAAEGKRVEIVRKPGLAFDLDQPEDLCLIRRVKAKRGSRVSAP